MSRTNSLNKVLITATTDTQNDISTQKWLSLTVGRAIKLIQMIFLGRGKIFVTQLSRVSRAGFPPFKGHRIQGIFQHFHARTFLGKFKDQNVQTKVVLK